MANRFWVGGTNTWNNAVGTKWATTSGGGGGSAVPTAADDVFFDGASGAGTVTIGGVQVNCRSMDCSGFTGTIAGTVGPLAIGTGTAGPSNLWLKLVAGMNFTFSGSIQMVSSVGTGTPQLLTTAGFTLNKIHLNSTTGCIQFQDNVTLTTQVLFVGGKLAVNGKTLNCTQLEFDNSSNIRTLDLGTASTINLSIGGNAVQMDGTTTNITVTGTGTINATGAAATFQTGGLSWAGSGITVNITGTGTAIITGAGTFYVLSRTGAGGRGLTFPASATVTITSALNLTGTSGGSVLTITSSSAGTAATISAAVGVVVTAQYLSLKDSTATGGARFEAQNSSEVSGVTGWLTNSQVGWGVKL